MSLLFISLARPSVMTLPTCERLNDFLNPDFAQVSWLCQFFFPPLYHCLLHSDNQVLRTQHFEMLIPVPHLCSAMVFGMGLKWIAYFEPLGVLSERAYSFLRDLEKWVETTSAVLYLVAQSCLTLCNPMNHSPPGSSVHGDSPGKNTTVGCHALLQGIFPTQA